MIDVQVALDKLLQFKTSEEIADFFRGEGIIGIVGEPTSCVIARWVQDVTGEAINGGATRLWELVDEAPESRRPARSRSRGAYSRAMKQFVVNFDNKNYPDLIDNSMGTKIICN